MLGHELQILSNFLIASLLEGSTILNFNDSVFSSPKSSLIGDWLEERRNLPGRHHPF